MRSLIGNIPNEVTKAVTESLNLLQQDRFRKRANERETSQPLPSLLERCEQFISEDHPALKEPVRLIHHFACTGGTLITKCLACSPNVQVLSEVDPLSRMLAKKNTFNPTDLIQLLEHSNRGTSIEEKLALFRASFKVIHETATRKGVRILVRDHTHSHFCTGDEVGPRPTLGLILAEQYDVRAIITVRHPLDSWLSLVKNGWVSFHPGTLDDYARRYQAFLDAYPDIRIFKYEDFVTNTDDLLREMCAELALSFKADFKALFMAHSFSGDSGRKGDVIKPRERTPVSDDLTAQVRGSLAFKSLCENLEYEI